MASSGKDRPLIRLRSAFERNHLCLFLGAGVSVLSGIPTWRRLVLNLFLNSLHPLAHPDLRVTAADQAVAELWFEQQRVPLEIATREIRLAFKSPEEFLRWVYFGLYQSFGTDSKGRVAGIGDLVKNNQTLAAIVSLCMSTSPGQRGLRSIVTYNLDGLLEVGLGSYPFHAMWKHAKPRAEHLPIYHVHGYLPLSPDAVMWGAGKKASSTADELVLTEDQYHREAENPYSWSNLVQLQAMAGSIGLTIGLSLLDPNMRRLLDVMKRSPSRPEIYALLSKPAECDLNEQDLQEIDTRMRRALKFYGSFQRDPPSPPDIRTAAWRRRIHSKWAALTRVSARRQTAMLRELGVEPIWCEYAQIPSIVEQITGADPSLAAVGEDPFCGSNSNSMSR